MSDWSNAPAGKNKYDRLTRGGVTKYWAPGAFGFGGSYQTAATLNAQRQKEGIEPIDFSKIGVSKSTPTPKQSETQLTPAQRTTKEREELRVVDGGKSGYRSLMPKPTRQKGETAQQLQQRTDRWNRSQQLAQRLTQQVKDQQPAATTQPAAQPPASSQPPATTTPAAQPPASSQPPATTTPAPAAPVLPAATQRPTQTQRPPESKVSPSKPAQTGDRTKDLTTWALANKIMIDKVGTKAQREILSKAQAGETMPAPRPLKASYEYDAYDLVLEYLLSQGHTDTVEEAHYVMMEMDAEMIGDIVEDGFNSSGRYDVGGGRTVGPVVGAIRSLVTGNLPKSKTYVPPSKQTTTNRPPATPASKDDSGKLTDFGAGGGRAKLKQGMTIGQVERQGRMNRGDYSG